MTDAQRGRIAYVLKGYPRVSELFVASEIHRVEQQGMFPKLFVIKPRDEEGQHEIIDRILAQPEYLPDFTSVSRVGIVRWLSLNVPRVAPALLRQMRCRPKGVSKAAVAAFAQAIRARRSTWGPPRKVYLKEFFQAVALVDGIERAGDVRHLHAHFCHGATTVAWLASLMTGLPFSFTAHAKDIYSEALNPAGLLARKLGAARFAVTCTEANRKHLLGLSPEARVHQIYHGLNAEFEWLLAEPSEPRSAQASQADPFRAIAVGRLVPKKGFDTFVAAVGRLRDSGASIQASLIGEDGEARSHIEDVVAEQDLGELVHLKGAMLQRELLHAMRSADAFVLPCRILESGDRDGIPNVLVEAMASGLPVVTTPVSGIPELVVDGVNGLLVPPDDSIALAAALERLRTDAALSRRLAEEGRRTVRERFDGRRETSRLVQCFHEISGADR